jgi:hypothetical protein
LNIDSLINSYVLGIARPSAWAKDLSTAHLDFAPDVHGTPAHARAGAWTMRQLIAHVLESDLIASHRMKRIACEHTPLLIAYDETAFASTFTYASVPIDQLITLFSLNRTVTASMLRELPEDAFEREGVHNQSGRLSLRAMLERYVHHIDHHDAFAARKRGLMGMATGPG